MSHPESDFSHLTTEDTWLRHINESIPPGAWYLDHCMRWRSAAGVVALNLSRETRPLTIEKFDPTYFLSSGEPLEDLGCLSLITSGLLGGSLSLSVETYACTIVDGTWGLTPEGVENVPKNDRHILTKVSMAFENNHLIGPFIYEASTSLPRAALALHLLGVFEPLTAPGAHIDISDR